MTAAWLVAVAYTDLPSDGRVIRAALAAARAGARVTVVVPASPTLGARDWPEFEVVTLPTPQERGKTSIRGQWQFMRQLRRWVSSADSLPDVIHIHNMPDYLYWVFGGWNQNGVRIVLDVHDIMSVLAQHKLGPGRRKIGSWVLRTIEQMVWRRVDQVVTVNEAYKKHIVSSGVADDRVAVVLNTPSEVHCAPHRRKVPHSDQFKIVWHGTVADRAGVTSLVRAFPEIKSVVSNARLLLVGSGEAAASVIREIRRLGIADYVTFENRYLPIADIVDLVGDADVGVVPNKRSTYTESILPVKLLEYCTLGIPVVATKLAVVESYMGLDSVVYVDSPEPAELARAIVMLAQDRKRRDELAKRGQEIAMAHRWARYEAVLVNALGLASDPIEGSQRS